VGRFLTIVALSALLMACQSNSKPVATVSPSPVKHLAVTDVVLQTSEIPRGLGACPGSGPIAGYLTKIRPADAALGLAMTLRWQQLQATGAVDAAINVVGDGGAVCTSELGVTTDNKSVASFVAVFADQGQAERAWSSGVLGFVPPAPDEVEPGLVRGTTTGLGVSSWTYDRPSVRLACWRRSVYVVLVIVTNMELVDFKTVTAAIDARIN
jgi:hypothetical protein